MADAGGLTIRLDGRPGHGQVYYESDFRDRIKPHSGAPHRHDQGRLDTRLRARRPRPYLRQALDLAGSQLPPRRPE
jgi:hypothetical protein